MFCPNCGTNLPDNAAFCGNCGTRIESIYETQQNNAVADIPVNQQENMVPNNLQGQDIPANVPQPPVQETYQSQPLVQGMYQQPPEMYQQPPVQGSPNNQGYYQPGTPPVNPIPQANKAEKKKSKLPIIIVLVALAAVLIVLGIILVPKLLGGIGGGAAKDSIIDYTKAPYFYTDKGDLYVLYPGDKEGTEIVSDFDYYATNFTAIDETTFYYIEDETLYFRDGTKKPVEVVDGVVSMFVGPKGSSIVILNDDEEAVLYNGKGIVELCDASEISQVEFSENGDFIAFMVYDEDYMEHLYFTDGKDCVEIEIDEDFYFYDMIGVGDDLVYYSLSSYEDYTSYIFMGNMDGDDEEIAEYNGYDVVYNSEDGSLLYVNEDNTLVIYDGKDEEEIADDISYFSQMYGVDDEIYMLEDEDEDRYLWYKTAGDLVEAEDLEDAEGGDYTADGKMFLVTTYDELLILNLKGDKFKVEEIDIEDISDIDMDASGKTAILWGDDGTVYLYKVGKDEAEEILEDVEDYSVNESYDRLLLLDDRDDLYYYNGSKLVEVGKDVASYPRLINDGKAYFYTDEDNTFFYGANGKEATEIAEEIVRMQYYGDGSLIYLVNEDDDVSTYKPGAKKPVELDVEADDFYTIYDFFNY